MEISQPVICSDENKIINKVLLRLRKTLVIGTPLAAGKTNHFINAFYNRAKYGLYNTVFMLMKKLYF